MDTEYRFVVLVAFLAAVLALFIGPVLASVLGAGAGSSAPFGIGGFLLRLGIGSIPTALVGAVAGVLGVLVAD